MAKIGGLGRGLDSLFSENSETGSGAIELRIMEVEPNKNQPRKDFSDQALEELSNSIKEHGLLQPILVRPLTNGRYQIIAGERRWRASRKAGLTTIKAVVRDFPDEDVLEIALIENLQREDLNPIEEAEGYSNLIKELGLTQEQVAKKVNKSRSYVANSLRVLSLDRNTQRYLKEGKITLGHAKALLSIEDVRLRDEALKAALAGASVREIENFKPKGNKQIDIPKMKDLFYEETELAIKNSLRRKVKVTSKKDGKGTLTIEFYNKEELSDIAKKLVDGQW